MSRTLTHPGIVIVPGKRELLERERTVLPLGSMAICLCTDARLPYLPAPQDLPLHVCLDEYGRLVNAYHLRWPPLAEDSPPPAGYLITKRDDTDPRAPWARIGDGGLEHDSEGLPDKRILKAGFAINIGAGQLVLGSASIVARN